MYIKSPKLLRRRVWSIWKLRDYFEVLPKIKCVTAVFQHLISKLSVETAGRYTALINQNSRLLAHEPASAFAKEIQETFVKFVVSNFKPLATSGFHFGELEESVLNAIFQRVK
jgi:hypothetical protein